jgi:hypothetical protein
MIMTAEIKAETSAILLLTNSFIIFSSLDSLLLSPSLSLVSLFLASGFIAA